MTTLLCLLTSLNKSYVNLLSILQHLIVIVDLIGPIRSGRPEADSTMPLLTSWKSASGPRRSMSDPKRPAEPSMLLSVSSRSISRLRRSASEPMDLEAFLDVDLDA
ncbi:hypothetical protein E2C01_011020 [Portunus trituberculatus]|uniref:Uncharacterized protein n=1 Tax=Portunus trituberculatus TaxID=210409 RepID=A0A5B7DAE6_PORTR|nr:hypothetical protein [Portunus trituberculatus]